MCVGLSNIILQDGQNSHAAAIPFASECLAHRSNSHGGAIPFASECLAKRPDFIKECVAIGMYSDDYFCRDCLCSHVNEKKCGGNKALKFLLLSYRPDLGGRRGL
jgi:hypothetical protein